MNTIAQVPLTHDHHAWRRYWLACGQDWRIEPEISEQRKQFLDQCRAIQVNVAQGMYPFSQLPTGERLTRADIEYLLISHEGGRGPVWYQEEYGKVPLQRRNGLDLRGADLEGGNLSNLPLCRVLFGPTWDDDEKFTEQQCRLAAANLRNVNLKGANLEMMRGRYVDLSHARLAHAYLTGAQLRNAILVGTDLHHTQMQDVDLDRAILYGKDGVAPRLADIAWGATLLSVPKWDGVRRLGDEAYLEQLVTRVDVSHDKKREDTLEALRAHLQVATILEAQGLKSVAATLRFRYNVQERRMFWRQRARKAWLWSLLLTLIAGYGYRLWRILVTYSLSMSFFALLFFLLDPHLTFGDAALLASTGRGLSEAPLGIWLVGNGEAVINSIIAGLFLAMVLPRFQGK